MPLQIVGGYACSDSSVAQDLSVQTIMDEDIRLFISEWLKDQNNDVWNNSFSSNSDIIEAIYCLIEEWKSNKDVTF